MKLNDYNKIASIYAKDNNKGTAYLAFKYIPDIINKYANGIKTLDFGCGSGLSTRFLKKIGLNVEGADINKSMLFEAKNSKDGIKYKLIKHNYLSYPSNYFDIVFSSFVLFEIESKAKLIKTFNEINRILKPNGIFIAITGSEEMYQHSWLSLNVDFPQNKNLVSGSIAKVHLKDIDLLVYDYFWTNEDYINIIKKTKFSLITAKHPMGDHTDGFSWISENKVSPYVIYILRK